MESRDAGTRRRAGDNRRGRAFGRRQWPQRVCHLREWRPAYRAGGSGGTTQISWYARDGKRDTVLLKAGAYGDIDLSPDDKYLSVVVGTGDDRNLWLQDLTSGVFSPLTTAAGPEADHVWSPDSKHVAYIGTQNTQAMVFETLIGSGKHAPIVESRIFSRTGTNRCW